MKKKLVYISVVVFFLTFCIAVYFIHPGYSVPAPELFIRFELNGGKIIEGNSKYFIYDELSLPYNNNNVESISLPTVFKEGFYLDGWYADSKLTRPVVINNTSPSLEQFDLKSEGWGSYSTTIYAKWNCIVWDGGSRTIYFESNGGSKVNEISICTTCGPSANETLPIPTRNGYEFVGWYSDKALTKRAYSIDDVNAENEYYDKEKTCPTNHSHGTFYAKWKKISEKECPILDGGSLSIAFNSNGGSSVKDISLCTMCGEEKVTLPTPTKQGYKFVGWYVDGSLTKKVTITSNHSSDISKLKTTVVKDSNGCDTTERKTKLYAKWEMISEKECPILDGGSLSIAFNSNGGSSIKDISLCTMCGKEKVTLPTPTKYGYLFAGWYTDSDFTTVVNIDSNLSPDINKLNIVNENDENGCSTNQSKTTLYARWIYYLEQENITINYIDNEYSKNITYNNQNSNELFIPEKDGYEFAGWYTDTEYTQKVSSYDEMQKAIFELEDDTVSTKLYAKWIEKEITPEVVNKKPKKDFLLAVIAFILIVVGVSVTAIIKRYKKSMI